MSFEYFPVAKSQMQFRLHNTTLLTAKYFWNCQQKRIYGQNGRTKGRARRSNIFREDLSCPRRKVFPGDTNLKLSHYEAAAVLPLPFSVLLLLVDDKEQVSAIISATTVDRA